MTDTAKFEGNGLSFKAKLIGVEEVPEARGDQMCQDSLIRLKNSVRASGEHKQKIFVNVTLEGLKIVDAISLAANQNKKKNEAKNPKPADENEETDKDKDSDGAVLHSHPVHRISFISRDTTDSRAFGYIYGDTDNTHKFFAIKTASAAEQLVYTIRDLFQAVYDMKKKEMEAAKNKLESGEVSTTNNNDEGNSQTPGNGSTSGTGQTPQTKQNAEGDGIYQVPPNNAPVKPEEQMANLLDLEDQTEHILKGIEQIKNLDFDSVTEDTQPTSPVSPPVSGVVLGGSNPDPWGTSQPAQPAVSTGSALGDLAGLQSSPFPGATFPVQTPFGAPAGFGGGPGGLPVTRDPFANDPFSVNAQRAAVPQQGFPAANPFASPQPFGVPPATGVMPQAGIPAAMPGMMPGGPGLPGVAPGYMPQQAAYGQVPGAYGAANPFGQGFAQMAAPGVPAQQKNLFGAAAPEDSNLLQPLRMDDGSGQKEEAADKAAKKPPRDDLFGDLVMGDIKKAGGTSSSDSPKDLFNKAAASEKKSINALMAQSIPTPTAKPPANQLPRCR